MKRFDDIDNIAKYNLKQSGYLFNINEGEYE